MEIICKQEDLVSSLNVALKAVSSKTSYPILECILMETENNEVRITSNDNDFCIETTIPAVINKAGKIAVNARMFSDLVRKLPNDDVIIFADENYKTSIICGKAKFAISGQCGDEFPKPLPYDNGNPICISQFTLKELIRQTIFSISDNESNKLMTGENIEIDGNQLRVTALDGYRVSIRNVELKESYGNRNVIVPGKTLNEIGKILTGDMDKEVRIFFDDKNIILEIDNTIVHSRLIEGKYYNINQMLSSDYLTKVTLNKRELIDCIDRASLFVKEAEKRPVIIDIYDNEMVISINSSLGSMNEEIMVEKEGTDLSIGFTPKFLLDVLRVIDDDTVTLYMTNAKAPCFIRDNENRYIYMILPVNIGIR